MDLIVQLEEGPSVLRPMVPADTRITMATTTRRCGMVSSHSWGFLGAGRAGLLAMGTIPIEHHCKRPAFLRWNTAPTRAA